MTSITSPQDTQRTRRIVRRLRLRCPLR